MALIGMRDVCWGFDDPPLLDHLTFQIEAGQRACLLGRNGVGKSTLLKLLCGDIAPGSGEVWRRQGIRVASMAQEVPLGFAGTIFEVVAEGLGAPGRDLAEYTRLCSQASLAGTPDAAKRREFLQHQLDARGDWGLQQRILSVLSRTRLDPDGRFADLSAGAKRRALFARALAAEPEILLLDEPTNHLDIDAILWMEEFILRHVKTLLVITHDRAFLKRVATRVLELDRGRLFSYECDYDTYQERKQAALDSEERQHQVFDRKLAKEEAWIRQGI